MFIQSFEAGNLRALRSVCAHPLVRLTGGAAPDVTGIAEYAHVIGPHMDQVIPRASDGRLAEPTSLVADARARRQRHDFVQRGNRNHPSKAVPRRWAMTIGLFTAVHNIRTDGSRVRNRLR